MENTQKATSSIERILSRLGGNYLFWMNLIILTITDISALGGFYYVVAATNLDSNRIFRLFISLVILSIIANILISLYAFFSTSTARARLNFLYRGNQEVENLNQENSAVNAWKEVFFLPSRLILVDFISILFLIILPAVLLVRFTFAIEPNQVIHILIGCLLSGISIIIFHNLLLEKFLQPVRVALTSAVIDVLGPRNGSNIRTRLFLIISFLVISTITMLAGIGFQRSYNSSQPGVDLAYEISQFQIQATILGGWSLVFGITLGILISSLISSPISELLITLESAISGNYKQRARVLTSDETSRLAFQLNILLEKLSLSTSNLEKQVEDRTTDLKQKSLHLEVVTNIFQEISTSVDLKALLEKSVQLISDNFNFYHVGLFLVDASREYAILHAASSEGGKNMIERGFRYEINQNNLIGLGVCGNQLQLIMDTSQDLSFVSNPDLPGTLSEIVIPLSSHEKVIGVLDIHSSIRNAFSSDDQDLLRTLADQVALAIQNSQLLEENRLSLQKLESLVTENVRRTWIDSNRESKPSYRFTPTSISSLDSIGESEDETLGENISIPIQLHGETLGKILLRRKGGDRWSDSDKSFGELIANQIGLALENSRLLNNAQQRVFYEQSLSKLTTRLGLSTDTDTLLENAIRELHQLPDVTEVSVMLTQPETSQLRDID